MRAVRCCRRAMPGGGGREGDPSAQRVICHLIGMPHAIEIRPRRRRAGRCAAGTGRRMPRSCKPHAAGGTLGHGTPGLGALVVFTLGGHAVNVAGWWWCSSSEAQGVVLPCTPVRTCRQHDVTRLRERLSGLAFLHVLSLTQHERWWCGAGMRVRSELSTLAPQPRRTRVWTRSSWR